jgi:hypothetical protein
MEPGTTGQPLHMGHSVWEMGIMGHHGEQYMEDGLRCLEDGSRRMEDGSRCMGDGMGVRGRLGGVRCG